MAKDAALEAHATAPQSVRNLQKYYQKLPAEFVPLTAQILDLRNITPGSLNDGKLRAVDTISPEVLRGIYAEFLVGDADIPDLEEVAVYEHASVPGLRILPSLIPIKVQEALLSKLLLRDLSDPAHLTNIHLHYSIPYTDNSFFSLPSTTIFQAKDPSLHKALPITDFLEKKLRWMTLGGQYDWTTKQYPSGPPVEFPVDIKNLVHGLFPTIDPQAAICNTYSPGDTLSPHRDVSEEADRDLISLSIGCDALFLISLSPESQENSTPATPSQPPDPTGKRNNKKRSREPPPPPPPLDEHTLVLRIRSGDAVVMGGDSRWAWHGVPKVLAETCPNQLAGWPDIPLSIDNKDTIDWTGWMKRKRVNLNIRQMFEVAK